MMNLEAGVREVLESVAEGHTDDDMLCVYCNKDVFFKGGDHTPWCITAKAKSALFEMEHRHYDDS